MIFLLTPCPHVSAHLDYVPPHDAMVRSARCQRVFKELTEGTERWDFFSARLQDIKGKAVGYNIYVF